VLYILPKVGSVMHPQEGWLHGCWCMFYNTACFVSIKIFWVIKSRKAYHLADQMFLHHAIATIATGSCFQCDFNCCLCKLMYMAIWSVGLKWTCIIILECLSAWNCKIGLFRYLINME